MIGRRYFKTWYSASFYCVAGILLLISWAWAKEGVILGIFRNEVYVDMGSEQRIHVGDTLLVSGIPSLSVIEILGPNLLKAKIIGEKEMRMNERVRIFGKKQSLYFFSVPPGARIFLNGENIGETPLEIEVEEGRHRVRLKKNGYIQEAFEIEAKRGERVSLNYRLKKEKKIITSRRCAIMGIIFTGIAIGADILVEDYYKKYNETKDASEAVKFRNWTKRMENTRDVSLGLSFVGFGGAIFLAGKEKRLEEKIGFQRKIGIFLTMGKDL